MMSTRKIVTHDWYRMTYGKTDKFIVHEQNPDWYNIVKHRLYRNMTSFGSTRFMTHMLLTGYLCVGGMVPGAIRKLEHQYLF